MEDGVEAERPETRRPGDQLGGCSKNCGNRGESGGGVGWGGVGGARLGGGMGSASGRACRRRFVCTGVAHCGAFNSGSSFTQCLINTILVSATKMKISDGTESYQIGSRYKTRSLELRYPGNRPNTFAIE